MACPSKLQHCYLERPRVELPAAARKRSGVVSQGPCCLRIIFDRLFGDCWYNHLGRRLTASKHLDDEQLRECT
jgi:hypothetical protein